MRQAEGWIDIRERVHYELEQTIIHERLVHRLDRVCWGVRAHLCQRKAARIGASKLGEIDSRVEWIFNAVQ